MPVTILTLPCQDGFCSRDGPLSARSIEGTARFCASLTATAGTGTGTWGGEKAVGGAGAGAGGGAGSWECSSLAPSKGTGATGVWATGTGATGATGAGALSWWKISLTGAGSRACVTGAGSGSSSTGAGSTASATGADPAASTSSTTAADAASSMTGAGRASTTSGAGWASTTGAASTATSSATCSGVFGFAGRASGAGGAVSSGAVRSGAVRSSGAERTGRSGRGGAGHVVPKLVTDAAVAGGTDGACGLAGFERWPGRSCDTSGCGVPDAPPRTRTRAPSIIPGTIIGGCGPGEGCGPDGWIGG